jgi:hypothetical protein
MRRKMKLMSSHAARTLEGEMPRDYAYELMRDVLRGVLPTLEAMARTAKNAAGRKQLLVQIENVRQALKAAEEASREATTSLGPGNSEVRPAVSPEAA